jgi:hypothetical protein
MESQNNKALKILVCVLCVLVLLLGGYIVYDKMNEKNVETENVTTNTEKIQTNNTSTNTSTETNTVKRYQDAYNENDTDLVKAQKIAKEVMNAINSKDYDYLAQMVGEGDVEGVKKYDVHNYKVDLDNYRKIDELNEFVFDEKYESNISNDLESELGFMLVITFEVDGKIRIDINCTGI